MENNLKNHTFRTQHEIKYNNYDIYIIVIYNLMRTQHLILLNHRLISNILALLLLLLKSVIKPAGSLSKTDTIGRRNYEVDLETR